MAQAKARAIGGIETASLEALRKKVRKNDEKMILLMGTRMRLSAEIGQKKKALGLPVRDDVVERAVVANALNAGKRAGVPPRLVARVMDEVMAQSRRRQRVVCAGKSRMQEGRG